MASTNDGHTYMQFNDSGKMGKSYPTHDIGPAAAIAQPINGAAMVVCNCLFWICTLSNPKMAGKAVMMGAQVAHAIHFGTTYSLSALNTLHETKSPTIVTV